MQVAAIFVALFASAFGIFYMYYVTRNKERMAMIEQGTETSLFKAIKQPREPRNRTYNNVKFTLKFGTFLIGLGIGFVLAVLLEQAFMIEEIELFVIGLVFVFGGLGLVTGYFLGLRIDNKRKE